MRQPHAARTPERLPSCVKRALRQAVAQAYPEEACGILLCAGTSLLTLSRAVICTNVYEGDRRHGFALDPCEHLRILQEAQRHGESTFGFFHSHPDGELDLSSADRRFLWINGQPAFPGELCCVVSTCGPVATAMRAYAPVAGGGVEPWGEWRFHPRGEPMG